MTTFTLAKVPSQKGKIIIVTGANIGLGYETTKALVQLGAKVIMACRNLEKAEGSKRVILKDVPDASIDVMMLDLSSQASVRDFCTLFKKNYGRLDVLINNAGVMVPPYALTVDGLESQMAINYFSHFLLTSLLFPILDKTENSRVVHLSSIAHKNAILNLNDINSKKKYSKMRAYQQSKLACLIFGFELQRRIDQSSSCVSSIIAHPGVSVTNIGHNIPRWIYKLGLPLVSLLSHPQDQAALSLVYAAVAPDAKPGTYYGPTGFNEMIGELGIAKATQVAKDPNVAQRLWLLSEKMISNTFEV